MPSLTIASDGTVTSPDVHDGNLVGIVSLSSRRALLLIRRVSGEHLGLRLVGVERLRVTQYLAGNVILDCTIETGPGADTTRAFGALELLRSHAGSEYAHSLRGRIERAELKIFTLNPSYGAEICALCHDVELVEADAVWAGLQG